MAKRRLLHNDSTLAEHTCESRARLLICCRDHHVCMAEYPMVCMRIEGYSTLVCVCYVCLWLFWHYAGQPMTDTSGLRGNTNEMGGGAQMTLKTT